jgi:hypothetical protein
MLNQTPFAKEKSFLQAVRLCHISLDEKHHNLFQHLLHCNTKLGTLQHEVGYIVTRSWVRDWLNRFSHNYQYKTARYLNFHLGNQYFEAEGSRNGYKTLTVTP